jgi:hypothetical protein
VKKVGIGTTVLAGIVLALAAVMGARSAADIKRYLEMRRM